MAVDTHAPRDCLERVSAALDNGREFGLARGLGEALILVRIALKLVGLKAVEQCAHGHLAALIDEMKRLDSATLPSVVA